jgi:phage-related tail fiber protein
MTYFAIPTLAGQAAIAAAIAGTAPLELAEIVVGDGGGSPTTPIETQVGLVNPRATLAVQAIVRTGSEVRVDTILDQNTGGWWVREIGILDDDGVLLFVASCPETYKGTVAEGVDDALTIGVRLVVSDTAQISLIVSPDAYATQAWVDENFVRKPAPFLFFGTM